MGEVLPWRTCRFTSDTRHARPDASQRLPTDGENMMRAYTRACRSCSFFLPGLVNGLFRPAHRLFLPPGKGRALALRRAVARSGPAVSAFLGYVCAPPGLQVLGGNPKRVSNDFLVNFFPDFFREFILNR